MQGRLSGRVALVTGGTRGIGEAIATRLAQEGALTVIASRKADHVAEAVTRLREATGGHVEGVPLHIGDVGAVRDAIAHISETWGTIDVLVNNAATNPYFGPMLGVEWAAWHKTFEVNLAGTFAVTREVVTRLLEAERPGSIIMLSSILGMASAPLQGVYGMTKAALISMTQTLAVELGGAGVRVNAIAPGLIDTRFASALTGSPELRRQFEERTASGRIGKPEDIAGTAAFLASDDSAYVTGQVIPVDGGYTIR